MTVTKGRLAWLPNELERCPHPLWSDKSKRDQILALFAAAAVGLAPAWAGATEHRGGDSRTDEAAASLPAPSWEELAGAIYTGASRTMVPSRSALANGKANR